MSKRSLPNLAAVTPAHMLSFALVSLTEVPSSRGQHSVIISRQRPHMRQVEGGMFFYIYELMENGG